VNTLTLVFDGYCGFCTRSVGWIKRLDRRDRVRVLPCQAPEVAATLGLTRADCEAAAWAFAPDGRRYRGAAAVNAALAAALGTALPLRIYRLPLIRVAQDAAYGWIARNRGRFRGVTPWCVAHPEAGPGGSTRGRACRNRRQRDGDDRGVEHDDRSES
jgi:predicted DCC family thiol-disulfide oxidoreductase YuxK